MQDNADKLVTILNQDFGLMDEVHTQGKDLQVLQEIKGQRYQMLMEVYMNEDLDKIEVPSEDGASIFGTSRHF